MPTSKEFKTIEQQIKLLEGRNLKFRNKKKAKSILSKYNYFDIINGFESILLKPESIDKEYDDVYFEDFYELYKFDLNLKKQTLFKVFDIESRMRTSIAYHFSSIHCNTMTSTMNYLNPIYYQPPDSTDTYLMEKFRHFDLFRNTQYRRDGSIKKPSFIDGLKAEKAYIGQYVEPPFWVTIKALPLGTLYYIYLFLGNDIKKLVLNDFGLSIDESAVFEQAIYIFKEVRNQCAHLELITRIKLKRISKLNRYNDLINYAGLSMTNICYMDVMKTLKVFGDVSDLKWIILKFYIQMCMRGRKKIADKILAKMGRKSIIAWLKI